MAEAAFVVGLIASIIQIIDGTKKVYDAVKDAEGQPKAFREVNARLPLVQIILREAHQRAATFNDPEALEPALKSCKAKAIELQDLFLKFVNKDDPKWYDKYKSALKTLGKGGKVEALMQGILMDIQLLACEKLIGVADEEQLKELKEAIKYLSDMASSNSDDAGGQSHSGPGHNIGMFGGSGNQQTINNASRDFLQHNYAAGSHTGSTVLKCANCSTPIGWQQIFSWCVAHNECFCEHCCRTGTNSRHLLSCLVYNLKIVETNPREMARCSNHCFLPTPRFQGIVCECESFKICDTCLSSGSQKMKKIGKHECQHRTLGSSNVWIWYGNLKGVRNTWNVFSK